jgi:hypothetical protein
MRYTNGSGSNTVVISYTSTLPPARMHAARVDVGVVAVGMLVVVGVDVVGSGVYVGRNMTVGIIGSASLTMGAGGSWITMLVCVSPGGGKGTFPQACTNDNTIKRTTSLLHTLAVYHKKPGAILY